MIVKLQGGLGNQMFQYAYGASRGAKFDLSGIVPPRTYALSPFWLPIEFNAPATEIGYWQSEKYFDHELAIKAFSRPKPKPPIENACAVHIRLTDNLSDRALAFHGNLLDTDYYGRAMRYVKEKTGIEEFRLFSDGIPWDRQPHEDIWEMARYPYIIIANSSFSWWGAWLGPQKLVVAPKRWFVVDAPEDCKDIVPDRWIEL